MTMKAKMIRCTDCQHAPAWGERCKLGKVRVTRHLRSCDHYRVTVRRTCGECTSLGATGTCYARSNEQRELVKRAATDEMCGQFQPRRQWRAA